jgi:hypothetical protein
LLNVIELGSGLRLQSLAGFLEKHGKDGTWWVWDQGRPWGPHLAAGTILPAKQQQQCQEQQEEDEQGDEPPEGVRRTV